MIEESNNSNLQDSNNQQTEQTPPLDAKATPALTDTPAEAWKPYTADPAKTADENKTLQDAHDATKPQTVKDEEARQAANVAPLDFTKIKLPAGFEVDEPTSKAFTDIINNDKLPRAERAQALIDLQAKFATSLSERSKTQWDTLQGDWQKQVQSDPDIGGERLKTTLTNINGLLTEFGGPENARELRAVLGLTGAGNNIHVAKFLNNIANKLREGGPISGAQPPAGTGAKSLYDKSPNLT